MELRWRGRVERGTPNKEGWRDGGLNVEDGAPAGKNLGGQEDWKMARTEHGRQR